MAKKILVVEDDPHIIKMLELRLKASGFEVITATDGISGLEKAKTEKPDLIIQDLMLPGMDGYKICRILKFDEVYKEIPIIMLTARGQDEDRLKGEQMGADFYMTKPYKSEELLEKINELLRERKDGQ